MGSSGTFFPNNHYNAQAKNQVKWLPNEFVQTVTASGDYRIHAFDQTLLDPAKRYALKIVKDSQRTYWGEVRAQLDASNRWIANGLLLGWKWPLNSGSNIQLIDTTPQSPGSKNDAPIVVGQTFSDPEHDIHLTTLAVNTGPTGERSVDVRVQLGDVPGNRPPTLALAASALNVPANAPITFTATAVDPDGDSLAYHWQSSNNTSATTATIGPNAPAFTLSFATDGQYVVTCTVSDAKGGRATRYLLVTVGNGGGRFAISGRVTLEGQGLPGVFLSTGTGNGVPTDSDGYYTIPNLTAGTYNVSAVRYGCTFTDLFNNGVLVGPSFSGAHFAADVVPSVSLTTSAPAASEAGAVAGRFTLTRTGADSEPLTVYLVPPTGTATLTSDYTISPAVTAGSPYNTIVIPAGAESLDLVVAPVNDAASEGPESVVLQLGLDASYVITGPPAASVVINDDDTALPKISVTADSLDAEENPARAASFRFARTGATTASLTLNLAISGTAASGSDYSALPATVTIPAGAIDTTATFSLSGKHVLRLSADDGDVGTFDEVTYAVTLGTAPTFAVQPQARQVGEGGAVTLEVTPTGTAPFTYQWRRDGVDIDGATDRTLILSPVTLAHAGIYRVVVTNAIGTRISDPATLAVVPTGTAAVHATAFSYTPGARLTITNMLSYPGTAAALEWQVLLPAGWTFASETASAAQTKPAPGATSLLTWIWTTVPASPLSFTYQVDLPSDETGQRTLMALAKLRLVGPEIQLLARPDPLIILRANARHSADTNGDSRLSLLELTRVIELFNTRHNTVRTGAYALAGATTEDGFESAPGRAPESVAILSRHHSADTRGGAAGARGDGVIDLFELTRVIAFYNYRTGTVRTGQYRVQSGTEDGFAPGP